MKRTRSLLAAIGLMVAAAAASLGAAPANAVVDSSPVVAVTGTNGALYAKHTSAAAWTNLGGYLIAAPGVAVVDVDTTQYVGIGGNGFLYQRTDTTGWRRLTTADYRCTQVSIVLSSWDGASVFGACTASNGALYAFSFDGGVDAPVATPLTKLTPNNTVAGQVSVTNSGSQPAYLYRGATYSNEDGSPGNTWALVDGTSHENVDYTINFPAASNSWRFEAFQQEGTMVGVYNYTEGDYHDIPGATLGSPALIDDGDSAGQLFVTGTNGAVYTSELSPTGNSPWTVIPGDRKSVV